MDDELLKRICHFVVDISLSIAIAFLIIWTLFSRVVMQGFSMSPRINDRDVVLVNRLYKRLLPINRYDVVAFYLNNQENLKRIIGIPGDTVRISSGNVYVNNEKVSSEYVSDSISSGFEQEVLVENGQYYVLGDNLYSSKDSRSNDVGTISQNSIIGKVWYVIGGN